MNREVSEGKLSDHGHFFSYEGHKERRTGKNRGTFSRMHKLWTAGCWLARRLHQLDISIFLIFKRKIRTHLDLLTMCGLEKLGTIVDQNWLERNLSALLLRTLVVGRRQQSESIEAALNE